MKIKAIVKRFGSNGEKTGWTYIEIPAKLSDKLKPGYKKSFTVKIEIKHCHFHRLSLLPVGNGNFILSLKADIRKKAGIRVGDTITINIETDDSEFQFDPDFMNCLNDDESAKSFFNSLPGSHQRYFSKWISGAKSEYTKANRILKSISALSQRMGYAEMMREKKEQ